MTNIEKTFWIETDWFIHSFIRKKSNTTFGFQIIFQHAQTFCDKPERIHSTKYSFLFVSYKKVLI